MKVLHKYESSNMRSTSSNREYLYFWEIFLLLLLLLLLCRPPVGLGVNILFYRCPHWGRHRHPPLC